MALPCAGPRKVEVISASELGTKSAAPAPWIPRATMSKRALGATAQASEARPNITSPARRIRRRPKVSDREPAIRISEPKASKYASTTHCCVVIPPPSSRVMAGRATLTIAPSKKATKEARMATHSTRRCKFVIRIRTSGRRLCAGRACGCIRWIRSGRGAPQCAARGTQTRTIQQSPWPPLPR